jgi:TatD DNase family protein
VVAIGECGLDYDRLQFCPRDVQLRHFVPHFTLAHEFGLPLFLHCRNAASDFVRIVREHRTKFVHAVVHSFDGTLSELQDMLDLGLHIGINGCSLKTQENLDVAAQIPLDRLLLETGMRQYT